MAKQSLREIIGGLLEEYGTEEILLQLASWEDELDSGALRKCAATADVVRIAAAKVGYLENLK